MKKPVIDLRGMQDLAALRSPAIFVEQMVELEPGRRGVGIKNVTVNEPYFRGLASMELPCYVITESLGQVANLTLLSHEANRGRNGVLFQLKGFEFHEPVRPGDRMWLEYRVTAMKGNFAKGIGTVTVDDRIVAEGELVFFWS